MALLTLLGYSSFLFVAKQHALTWWHTTRVDLKGLISSEHWTYLEHWATSWSAGRERTDGWSRRMPWQNCWWRKQKAREREAAAALKSNFTSPVERKTERECGLKILIHKMGNKRKQAVRNKIKLADGCISIFLFQNGLCQISRTINNLNTDNNFPHANPNPER